MELLDTSEKKPESDDSEINEVVNRCEEYRGRLVNYCLRTFSFDYATAQDIVQNAYVALYENLLKGVEIENYRAWMYRVTFYFANKVAKDVKRRNECELTDDIEIGDDTSSLSLEDKINYKEKTSDINTKEAAVRIISSLKKDERELYIMYYCENKKLKDIAEQLNVSDVTVRKRNSRLKHKLKDMIKDFMEN